MLLNEIIKKKKTKYYIVIYEENNNKMKLKLKQILLRFIIILCLTTKQIIAIYQYEELNSNIKSTKMPSTGGILTANGRMEEIKLILNMEITNKTLDKFVKNNFNIESLNPSYIFLIPQSQSPSQSPSQSADKLNKNLEIKYHRNNFDKPIFPNVTRIKENMNMIKLMMKTNAKLTDALNVKTKPDRKLFNDFLLQNPNGLIVEAADDVVDRRITIVNENVRTERNFIDHHRGMINNKNVKKLNEQNNRNNKLLVSAKQNDDNIGMDIGWDDLGLNGWTGHLTEAKELYDESLEVQTTQNNDKQSSNVAGVNISSSSSITRPLIKHNIQFKSTHFKHQKEFNIKKNNFNEIMENQLGNWTTTILSMAKKQSTKWSLTNVRSDHKTKDIYIGRANNPFGHSTKWKLKNDRNHTSARNLFGSIHHRNDRKLLNNYRGRRSKRSVIELYSMIKCGTGCDPIIFKGYGCYCGFLGSGFTVDGIDSCCKMHDYCYEIAQCPMFLEYFVPYLWKCYRGQPICAIDNGEWGGPGSCSTRLCKCDQALANCLQRYYCPAKRSVCQSSPWRLLQNYLI